MNEEMECFTHQGSHSPHYYHIEISTIKGIIESHWESLAEEINQNRKMKLNCRATLVRSLKRDRVAESLYNQLQKQLMKKINYRNLR
jgi:hypothetical protein